ncbi:MAG: SpoIIE family protein phosphatase [Anaerolineae bacterium]|nr:SpoIIE family protein phosphatase [Anaerolineae bacterium]
MSEALPQDLTPQHLATLYQISMLINSTLDFQQALDNVIDAIMQVTRAQRGFLMLHDEANHTLQVLVARGIDGAEIAAEGYSTTIASRVLETRETILTNNAEYDPRFSAGQSIIMRGLRAILCTPMMVKDRLIGIVYVDTSMKAGVFRSDDVALLKAVSGIAAQAIENARLFQVAIEKGRLDRELQMGREIQRTLLPRHLPQTRHYDIASFWEAAREVAGDFYDAFSLGDGRVATVIADVSDKGVPASLFMAVTRTLIRGNALAGLPAPEVVRRANDLLTEDAEASGTFVTLFYGELSPSGRTVQVNAGHNPPLLRRYASKSAEFLPTGGRALGWFVDNPVRTLELQLQPGDVIVYYTDGLTDAENPHGIAYGEARLAEAVLRLEDNLNAQQMCDRLLRDVLNFCQGNDPFDDLTLLIVRYLG